MSGPGRLFKKLENMYLLYKTVVTNEVAPRRASEEERKGLPFKSFFFYAVRDFYFFLSLIIFSVLRVKEKIFYKFNIITRISALKRKISEDRELDIKKFRIFIESQD
jgi:hypothetical protein